ncbi:MAG: protein kinase domain-containing protein [Pirellula sp.]|jgi:serine/threonine protein kinase|nr:protein kinase [Pirellula sp.]
MDFTPRSLTQRIVDLDLASGAEVDKIWAEFRTENVSLDDVKSVLLRKGLLTNFQLERMLTGERLGYFYGPYKVLYMIGAGTFARVFRAVHRDTGRVVAVKVLRSRHRGQIAEVEQFLREGRMGLQLKHPNIVTIHDIQNDPRAPYLVMEFVEGETLREILKIRKQFGPVDGLNVVHDICSGLDFAFQKGITHRDLKLSNVLVHSSGKCKLVDFGLAAMADTSSDKAIADCPSARAIDYAALERGTGVRKGDTRSDIYFVGVMMYNIISGKQALVDTRERSQRLNVTRFHDFPSLSEVCRDLPEQIYTICNKALEFDPEKRYQNPSAMLADIQLALKKLENPNQIEKRVGNRHNIVTVDEEDAKEGEGKTVMVVENKQELQDVLREKLKKRGYKVLIYGDPERALSKFSPDESTPADCLVICAPDLGNLALEAFNKFAEQDHTKTIPAVMLVDPKQQHIIRGANTSPIHVLLPMPLKVRELRQALAKLTAK